MSLRQRFSDPWWRSFDKPTDGYRDSLGFVNRLPLRLESDELIVYGTVDAKAVWSDYEDEIYSPITIDGDKAVVSVWFNKFKDTDCGGAYLETWYNTFVSRKNQSSDIKYTSPYSLLDVAGLPQAQSFLMRVICGDTEDNPGAAIKAIVGGREIFGFPKHPQPGNLSFKYLMKDEKTHSIEFDAKHNKLNAVFLHARLPSYEDGHLTVPLEVSRSPANAGIGSPINGGTHKGHNGAFQSLYSTSVKCTQTIAKWNSDRDVISFGDSQHYYPIKTWNFQPLLKVYSDDFKICAHRPSGWISGEEAKVAVLEHESKLCRGVKGGEL